MKKQKRSIKKLAMGTTVALLASLCLTAQDNTKEVLNPNGRHHIEASENYVDYTVPDNGSKVLYLEARGADGGASDYKAGRGAMISGWVKIGDGRNEIPVNSTIRFIVGRAGQEGVTSELGGGGGGGTAVAFQKPNDTKWHLLMVAGGGGGDGVAGDGREAEITEGGSNGKRDQEYGSRHLHNAGKNGEGGGFEEEGRGGGGGAKSPGQGECGGDAGFDENGVPTGGEGGCAGSSNPGFGFGGGGRSIASISGSGGGGYSGGGAGENGEGAGGGGSYLDNSWFYFPLKKKNGTTHSPQHGYVKYELKNEIPWAGIHPYYDRGKCVDLSGGTDNGTNILVSRCSDKNAQTWLFEGSSIRSAVNVDKCLDLAKNNGTNGTNIQLYDCNGSNAQKWFFDGLTRQIRKFGNWGKCLERANNNIRIWDCQGRRNQQWKMDGDMTAEGGSRIKTIRLAKTNSNKCMELFRGKTDNENSNIRVYSCKENADTQKWLFDGINIRYYKQQNKCVDLAHNKTDNGTDIRLWDCNRSAAQHWVYDGMTGLIRYRKNLDKCLVAKYVNVEIQDCNGTVDQRWKMKDADTPFGSDKVMSIKRFIDDKKCMDVDGGETTNGTNIQLWDCHGNTNQQWTYDGLYLRYKKDPSKCLDLKAANTHRGNNIQLYACNGTKAQRWLYDQKDHKIRYADNWNRCLEVYRNLNQSGTNIQIYDCRDTDAQRWIMK